MAILVLEHHPLETPARLGRILNENGHKLRVVQLHDPELVAVFVEDAPQPGGGFERVVFENEDGHEGEVTAPQRYTFVG